MAGGTGPQYRNFLRSLTHTGSGMDIDPGFIIRVNYIESMDLTGPKLILHLRDLGNVLQKSVNFQSMDELKATFADDWRENGESFSDDFVILSAKILEQDRLYKLECISKPTYKMKQISDKTKIFTMKGVSNILQSLTSDLKVNLQSKFGIVENYHLIQGERPTSLLKQLGEEQGSEVWIQRGGLIMQRFSDAFKGSSSMTFEANVLNTEYPIFAHRVLSEQLGLQENKIQINSGWNAEKGRVGTSTSNPMLKGVKSLPTVINGNPNAYTLGAAVAAKKRCVEFTTMGNLSIKAGMPCDLVWHEGTNDNPTNESMPPKIVVSRVAHWFQDAKYYTKIEGSIPFESQQVLF